MTNLKRFTTRYQGAEDRILITGEDRDGKTVAVWLTQRLLLKTLPVLIDWLQKNHPADLKTRDNSAEAQAMAQVFSNRPVEHRAVATPASPQAAPRAEPAEPEPAPAPALVQNIDLNLSPKLLRVRFREEQQELANLAMTGSQLRQWLAVLQVLWNNAGWPQQVWPRWLSDDAKLVSNETRGNFH